MALVVPGHTYKLSLGKQTAEGTPVANPDYQIPVYSGPLSPNESRSNLQVADGNPFYPGQFKDSVWADGTVEWMAEPASLPRLLVSHLGSGSDTVTGAGDPWTHTMTRQSTPLWHTHWTGRPVAGGTFEYDKIQDVLTKAVEIRYTQGQLVRVATEVLGKKAFTVATTPTPGATVVYDPIGANGQGYTWVGATLLQDLDTTPAATATHALQSFVLRASYDDMKLVWTDDIFAQYFDIGRWNLSFSASFVVEDWKAYNATFFGSKAPAANTPQSATTLNGAIAFTLNTGPTANTNRTTVITVNYMQFMVEAPDIQTDGSGLTVNMTGVLTAPAAGAPLTIATKSAVSTTFS